MCCQTDTMTNLVVCALLVAVALIEPPPAFANNCPFPTVFLLLIDGQNVDACYAGQMEWYRILVNSIDVDLSSEPPVGSCATNSSFYLKDPLNTNAIGLTVAETCVSTSVGCVLGPIVRIFNCGDYRAYQFGAHPLPCPSIFCLDTKLACPAGTTSATGFQPNCIDINECEDDTRCDLNAVCANSPGSYNCTCAEGFEGDGKACTDINECEDDTRCDLNAVCANSPGSYNCTCIEGFEGDGKACTDINECEDDTRCDLNAVCANSPGSYNCTCAEGFEGDGKACTALFPVDLIRPAVCLRGGTSSWEGYYKKLRFECRFDRPDANYFYDVVWRINGNEVTRLTKLRGSYLPRAGQLRLSKTVYKTGINVQCAVRVRATADGFPSPEHKSDDFFFQRGAGLSYKEWVKRGCGRKEERNRSSGERNRSSGGRSSGERNRSSGGRSSGERNRSSEERNRSSGGRSSGERNRSSGERNRSSGERNRSSGEKKRSSGGKD